ncbi:hypothetical protein BJY00DRAFT_277850 [Aspergillus carlsbadensis]|nr:hypothetical protein BJY00DRAFT_277850 [Aspergillus carlsbadensis]
MRSILPFTLTLTLLPTTILAQSSVSDLIRDLLPECIHSCALDTMESLYDCSLDDAACFCEGDVTTITVLEEWLQCPNSSCDEDDIQALAIDPEEIIQRFRGVCAGGSDSGGDSGSDSDDSDSGEETSSDSESESGDSEDSADAEAAEDGASTLSPANTFLAAGAIIVAALL